MGELIDGRLESWESPQFEDGATRSRIVVDWHPRKRQEEEKGKKEDSRT